MLTFNENSTIVKSYVLLIQAGERTLESVPNVGNLKEVVAYVLGKS